MQPARVTLLSDSPTNLISYLDHLQSRLSCVATAKVTTSSNRHTPGLWQATLNRGEAVPVRGGSRRLSIEVHEELAAGTRPPEAVRGLARYRYELREFDGREILAYHLHPGASRSVPNFPHLHVSGGAGDLIPELQRAHLPTGAVSLADFVALLIRDFGVRPLRPEWEEILASPAKRG